MLLKILSVSSLIPLNSVFFSFLLALGYLGTIALRKVNLKVLVGTRYFSKVEL